MKRPFYHVDFCQTKRVEISSHGCMKGVSYSFLFLLFFLSVPFFPAANSQTIYKSGMIEDLEFLQAAILQGHPINYHPEYKVGITAALARAKAFETDTLSYSQYRLLLAEALQELGCLHTTIHRVPAFQENKPTNYFPLRVVILQNRMYLTQQSKQALNWKEGAVIQSINGISTQKLIPELLKFGSSDGGGQAFARAYVNRVMATLLPMYFGHPPAYEVELEDGSSGTFKASDTPVLQVEIPLPYPADYSRMGNKLVLSDQVAILKMTSFQDADQAFLKSIFPIVLEKEIPNLILDLRGNVGGKRKTAKTLTQWLVDQDFSYAILQPNLDPKPFLNDQGKRNLFLARLRYNIGNVFKGKKTPLGREFTYRFKPKKQTYQGNLYVLTDGFTASSATMVTSWLKQHSNAVFAGRQASGGYNGNNGGTFPYLTLPSSGIEINFPVFRLILDPESNKRTGIQPDFPVQYTISDYLKGRDMDLNQVLDLIRKDGFEVDF